MDGIRIKCTSFWQILLNSRALFGIICLFGGALSGVSPHREKPQQIPSIAARFHLVDLGEINAGPEELSKFNGLPNASPSINNAGEVIANAKEGGVFIRPNLRAYNPRIQGARLDFRSINNHGDILVGINRGSMGTDWVIWPKHLHGQEKSIHISPVELQGSDILLSIINDAKWVVGETHPDGHYRPLLWTPNQGLYRVGFFNGMDLKGVIRQLNERGTVLGQFMGNIEHPPFVWDPEYGLLVLDKYRRYFTPQPEGRIEFSDLIMSQEGIVYGTYWINDQLKDMQPTPDTPHQSFIWVPTEKQFYLTNHGMRLAQVNSSHEIVGAIEGKAALREPGKEPVALSAMVRVEDLEGWDLLEATGINDAGQIVGYGTRNGSMHLFRADPLP